jgi:hypothetical protein
MMLSVFATRVPALVPSRLLTVTLPEDVAEKLKGDDLSKSAVNKSPGIAFVWLTWKETPI